MHATRYTVLGNTFDVVLPEKTEVRELLTTAYKTNTTWGGRKGGGGVI